jgi:hypothetical protein
VESGVAVRGYHRRVMPMEAATKRLRVIRSEELGIKIRGEIVRT